MTQYVIDSIVCIAITGIRTVSRAEGYDGGFNLLIDYKGFHTHFKYPTRTLRDETFEKICAALEERNKSNRSQK